MARVRTPVRLQMEATECGAACLGIILEHHGKYVPLEDLRRECGISRDGSRAANLVRAARRYGLEASGLKKEVERLFLLEAPFVIFWNFRHFLVVEGFDGKQVWFNDPAVGHRAVSLEEFDECYTGVALTFAPGEDFQPGGSRPSAWKAVVDRLRGSKETLLYCLLAGLFLAIPGLILPVLGKVFVDEVLTQGRIDWLKPLILGMLGILFAQTVLHGLQLRSLRRLKVSLAARMSSQFIWHALRLPMSFYAQRSPGEVATRARLNDRLADLLSGRLAGAIVDLGTMAAYAALMVAYDFTLTAIGVLFAAANIVALRAWRRHRVEAAMRVAQSEGKVSGMSVSALQRIETIKASGTESATFERWSGLHARSANMRAELESSTQALGVLPVFLSQTAVLLVLAVGGLRVVSGEMSIGTLVALQALMLAFLRPIGRLVELGGAMQDLEGDMARVDDLLVHRVAETGTREDTRETERDWPSRLGGKVELRSLHFGYSPLAPPLIDDFNLSLEPGQRVALVGSSGSGKTTVAQLVGDLHEPWSGEVLFDEHPRHEIPQSVLVNSFAMVSQEIFLFAGSVRDNLTLWDESIPDADLLRACEDAAILDTVLALPGGLDGELIEGGANLSGGQRQRLEIARALVRSPSILVLDEATSALDAETEALVDERLRLRGCTCLIVAHRLSTIRDCDEILIMERGQVVERGTHEELWQSSERYVELLQAGAAAG